MLPEFALPGRDRDRAHDTDYPVWVTPRDTEAIYLARQERAVQAAKKAGEAGDGGVLRFEGGGSGSQRPGGVGGVLGRGT